MADDGWTSVFDPKELEGVTPPAEGSPTWGDYGAAVSAGTKDLGAGAAAITRSATDLNETPGGKAVNSLSKFLQKRLNESSEEDIKGMSPSAHERIEAAMTDPAFLSHPASAALLKGARMTPAIAATVVPGLLTGGAASGMIATAIAGGVVNAGAVVNDIDKELDKTPDDKLTEINPHYAASRAMGMSEEDARADLADKVRGLKPWLNAAIGAAATAIGPAGGMVRGVTGGAAAIGAAERGALASAGIGAAEGAGANVVQAGAADASVQNALMEAGTQKDYDWQRTASAVIEGAVMGGVPGGVAGGVFRGHGEASPAKAAEKPATDVTVAPKSGIADVAAKPPEDVAVGNPQSAPTRSETRYPKAEQAKRAGKKGAKKEPEAAVVDPGAPDAAQTAALGKGQEQPAVAPEPAPVTSEGNSAPLPEPALPEPPRPVTVEPAAAPARVPPVEAARPAEEPAPKPPMTEGDKAAYRAAGVPVPEDIAPIEPVPLDKPGRILQAQDAESKANAKAQRAAQKANIKAATAEPKQPGTKNYTLAEKAQIQLNNERAPDVVAKFEPGEGEADYAHASPTKNKPARAAIMERARGMVADAEAADVKIPQRIKGEKIDALVLLREAADLAKKEKPTRADFNRFVTREKAIRGGAKDEVVSERKAEGDLARRKDQAEGGDVDKVDTGKAHTFDAPAAETPEDVIGRREDDAENNAAAVTHGSEKEAYESGNARRPVVVKGPAFETPKAPRVPVVEKKRSLPGKPTEAQKAAGNYPKEHLKIGGLDITVENRRGSERSGIDKNGKRWSVKMPDHYGYIKRTVGADGDHVDVYLGPKAAPGNAILERTPVHIIDQVDATTGKFDEHKVMLGYDTEHQARDAYIKGFSDGKGPDRIGKVTTMTLDEFKTWVASDAPKKATKPTVSVGDRIKLARRANQELQSPQAELSQALKRKADEPTTITKRNTKGEVIGTATPIRTMKASEVLQRLDLSHITGVAKPLAEFFHKKLTKLAGDVPVHIISDADMDRFSPAKPGYEPALGEHNMAMRGDQYVTLRVSALNDPKTAAHVVMHELAHAATSRALFEDPHVHRAMVSIMSIVRDRVNAIPKEFQAEVKKTLEYGLTNPREFIAEAFSNPEVQDVLSRLRLPDEAARSLGLDVPRNTAWDAVVNVVTRILTKLTGKVPQGHRMIEAIMRVGEHLETMRQHELDMAAETGQRKPLKLHGLSDDLSDPLRMPTRDEVTSAVTDARTNAGSKLRDLKDRVSSVYMLRQRAAQLDHEFGERAHGVVENKAKMEREKTRILEEEGGQEVVRDIAQYERTHGAGEFERVAQLGFDASNANVELGPHAKNDHLGVDRTKGWQGKARLPDLQRRYNALPEEGKALLQKTVAYFKGVQDKIALQDIKNILDVAGVHEAGLAERIHADGLTEADKAKFKTNTVVNALNDARGLKKISGWYLPFRRFGDFVVSGHHELAAPKGATLIGRDVVQFADRSDTAARRAAQQFVENHDLTHTDTKSIYVDKNDLTKILPKDDVDAIPAYRVKLQTQHTEFHPDQAAAQRSADNLKTEGLKDVSLGRRADEVNRSSGLMGDQMKTVMASLEQQDRFKAMPKAQRDSVRQTLLEASVRLQGSTRLQSGFVQRRNVGGMSHDLARVTADYARSSAGYLARLRFQPDIDKAFTKLDEHIEATKYDKDNLRRQELRNELASRLHAEPQVANSAFSRATKRLLQISRLDKLAGVSFHVINSQEPWTTSLPVIGGRHGFAAAARNLAEAYNTIGARGGVMASLKDTAKAYSQDFNFTDYVKNFKDQINASKTMGPEKAKRLNELLDYVKDRGLFSDEAVFEVSRYADPTGNAAMRALDRADLMANQVGNAIEKINRSVTAIASYNLEFKRNGGNHEAAMRYAFEVTHDVNGDYSGWNASPYFKGNAGQLALQFKKFAHKTYYLLGKTLGSAIRGDTEAMKQFGGLMVTHMVVAGALGLPTEPIKVALMAANWLGLTGTTMNDVDAVVRRKAAELLGVKGGEAFSHGLTRLSGVDTSTRQGLDSLMTFGAPKSTKANDLWAWLGQTMAGAPAGLMMDWIQASQALAKGDFAKAIEKSVPLKAFSDITKAAEGYAGPKVSAGGRETVRALTPYETAMQAIGFTPSVNSETFEQQSNFYGKSKEREGQRSEFYAQWSRASGSDRAKMWGKVEAYNKGVPKDAQITRAELDKNAQTRKKEEGNGTMVKGMRVTKRNKDIAAGNDTYNTK